MRAVTATKTKVAISIGITIVVTLVAFWFLEQSPPSAVGTFLRAQEDILFPFAWITALLIGHALWLTYPIALLQFPIYSILLELAWIRRRRYVVFLILAVHSAAAVFCRVTYKD